MYLLDANNLGQDFFTVSTFESLAGATFIVFAICSGVQSAFNYNPKWLALAVSVFVSLVGAYLCKTPEGQNEGSKYIIAFLNGFLIYTSASGTNQVLGRTTTDRKGGGADRMENTLTPTHNSKRTFLSRWI